MVILTFEDKIVCFESDKEINYWADPSPSEVLIRAKKQLEVI
jgi:hypothetical protein